MSAPSNDVDFFQKQESKQHDKNKTKQFHDTWEFTKWLIVSSLFYKRD